MGATPETTFTSQKGQTEKEVELSHKTREGKKITNDVTNDVSSSSQICKGSETVSSRHKVQTDYLIFLSKQDFGFANQLVLIDVLICEIMSRNNRLFVFLVKM